MGPRLKGKSCALWLVPEGEVYRRLARTIRRLSREFSTPVFAPHITLASGIVAPEREVATKTAQLARSLRPLRLRLTYLDSRHEYFRCLFAKVARVQSLVRAHRRAKETFGLREQRGFLPHVSLIYGNLSREKKRRVVASLGRRFDLEFDVRRLRIVAIHGAPSAWRRVRVFRLPTG